MNRHVLALAALAALCPSALPQRIVRQAPPAQAVEASSRFDNLFYKAYYLEHGAAKPTEAAELYREYLESTGGKGPHVREAASLLAALLERRGDTQGARALRAAHGQEARPTRPAPQEGASVDREQWLERRAAMIQGLEAQLRQLETTDPQNPRLQPLRQRIEALKAEHAKVQAGEAPPEPQRPTRMGMGAGPTPGQPPSLATMPAAERSPFVEQRAAGLEQMAERMAERNPEMAATLKQRAAQMRKLAAEGKWTEIDALLQQAGGLRGGIQRGEQQPGQRGEQPGGFQRARPFAEMPAEERGQALAQRLEQTRNMAARMRERGNEEAATRLLETAERAQKLGQEGKWAELDELLRRSMTGIGRGQRPGGGERPGTGQRQGGGQRPGGGQRGS